MRPEIREDVEPFARNLHEKKWKSSERDAIRDEFFLTEEEADATAEILIELEKSDRKSTRKEGSKSMEQKLWYAVMRDREDDDWGYGSYDIEEAKQMLTEEESPEAYIAVIAEGENPVCVDEILREDI